MSTRIKIAGTINNQFEVGLKKVTLDSSLATQPYTLRFPTSTGSNNSILSTTATGNLFWAQGPEQSPQFLYNSQGLVSTITYMSGSTKTLTYNTAGVLQQIDYLANNVLTRKTFSYNSDGTLAQITQQTI